MSQIIDVATWVALLAGIAGITLSVVAIWFTFAVEKRSRTVTEQTIQRLQKIESFVERSSADTQGLIKVAWDRMMDGMDGQASKPSIAGNDSESDIQKISAGVAEEVRAELGGNEDTTLSSPRGVDEDRIVERVSEAIQAQLRSNNSIMRRPYERVREWANTLAGLSPAAYELLRFLGSNGHLNRTQYLQLTSPNSAYRSAVFELRRLGIIIPLVSPAESKKDLPVYWFPPNDAENLRIALELTPKSYPPDRSGLRTALKSVGYLRKDSRTDERGGQRREQTDTEAEDSNSKTTEEPRAIEND